MVATISKMHFYLLLKNNNKKVAALAGIIWFQMCTTRIKDGTDYLGGDVNRWSVGERGAAGCLGEAGGAMCCPDAEIKDNMREEAQS